MIQPTDAMIRILSFILLSFACTALYGYRREYVVTLNDARKAGSEVCFYRGQSAIDAFSLFFFSGKTGCLPADSVLDLPPGLFHAFARHKDGYVSEHLDFLIIPESSTNDSGYETLAIPLARAGRVDFSQVKANLRPRQALGVWLVPSQANPGLFLPLIAGEPHVMVPVGRVAVPLLIEGGVPIAIGDPIRVSAGDLVAAPPFRRRPGRGDVVAWLKLDRQLIDSDLDPALPMVRLVADGEAFESIAPIQNVQQAPHALLIFRDIPVGPATLRVEGPTWIASEVPLNIIEGVAIHRSPVLLAPASSIEVTWPATERPASTHCLDAKSSAGGLELVVTVRSCGPSAEGAGGNRCTEVAREQVLAATGAVRFADLPSGDYEIEAKVPYLRSPIRVPVQLRIAAIEQVALPLVTFDLFGRVTVDGKPAAARLSFVSGEAISDSEGAYTARLFADPKENLVDVALCTSGARFRHIVAEPMRPNSRYDIEIDTRRLLVNVADPDGRAIAGASVSSAPQLRDGTAAYRSEAHETDQSGQISITIPEKRAVTVCASHDDYLPSCANIAENENSDRIRLQLRRAGSRGRIEGHTGNGALFFVDPVGRVIESVRLRTDGSFVAGTAAAAYLVYTSDAGPLAVLSLNPQSGTRDQVIALPAAATRSFRVRVTEMTEDAGVIGVWVGGRLIPVDALQLHQESRGIDVLIERGRSLNIRDIAAVGPIEIAFAPFSSGSGTNDDFVDPFSRPPYASVQRTPVTGDEVTIAR